MGTTLICDSAEIGFLAPFLGVRRNALRPSQAPPMDSLAPGGEECRFGQYESRDGEGVSSRAAPTARNFPVADCVYSGVVRAQPFPD